ncbi:alkane 1-monooxygenase [Puniceibacterium sp. IMCC21224]|uniref:alkane 1-monooxygenase n=1 Tax=Puniceibacterium sp. IMCC21224 TaxID=1618204 RepID=UPI00065DAE56|nr:alkane 1-monooxygenase [Puniceibacterium sp. IMCC21224]KMK67974.1 alkane 1-monooxygenase [Puniceibacterium sp. IMCC21224]
MTRFVLITLGMALVLALALCLGGIWPPLALGYITVFTFLMDKVTALAAADAPQGAEFPAGHGLSTLLGLLHFLLLYGGVAVLSDPASRGAVLDLADKVLCFLALALFLGQVSNSNAHELIHRSARWPRRLGVAIYCSLLFGHHASAHPRVHHVHAATDADPNSARLGEGFYAFALRAWTGSFRAGLRAERALRAQRPAATLHPYAAYGIGAAASVTLAALLGGTVGVAVLLGLAVYAQIQLLLSDYVQHYGLRRSLRADGRPEPVGPAHSWNAPHGFSSALMLNAPRHSDHHAHPSRPYPGLSINRDVMPILPHSLPVMAVIALAPALWRRMMDNRAHHWSADDATQNAKP